MTTFELIVLAVRASIFLTVLGLGMSATWRDTTTLLRDRGLLACSLLAMFIAMPVLVGVIAHAVDLPYVVKVALVALAIAPVPPILPKKELKLGGRTGYAVSLLALSALIAIVYVPVALEIFVTIFEKQGSISPLAIAKIMFTSVFAPLLIGLGVRHFAPTFAGKASGVILTIGNIALVLGCIPILIGIWPAIQALIGNGTVLVIAIITVLGLAIGHTLGGPNSDDRTVLALSTSTRHPAVALAVATSGGLQSKPELAAILLYVLVATVVAIPYTLWRRRSTAARAAS